MSYSQAAGGSSGTPSGSSGGGGFGGDSSSSGGEPNASFNTDIGGQNDPGRVALSDMQASAQSAPGVPSGNSREVSNDGQFDVLGETSA
jgi:hypothetical protein